MSPRDEKGSCVQAVKTDINYDILTAGCGCPCGKGSTASRKHIGALCYVFQSFCDKGNMPEFLTCTQKLQEWNKPCARKVDQIAVEDIRSHQKVIMTDVRNPRIPSDLDPRSEYFRQPDLNTLDAARLF